MDHDTYGEHNVALLVCLMLIAASCISSNANSFDTLHRISYLGTIDRNKHEEDVPPDNLAATKEGRKGEGLKKIYGPEWGITELDFEADYKNYQSPEMKHEYGSANKGVKPTGYRASRPGHQSVGNAAWMQEVSVNGRASKRARVVVYGGDNRADRTPRKFDYSGYCVVMAVMPAPEKGEHFCILVGFGRLFSDHFICAVLCAMILWAIAVLVAVV